MFVSRLFWTITTSPVPCANTGLPSTLVTHWEEVARRPAERQIVKRPKSAADRKFPGSAIRCQEYIRLSKTSENQTFGLVLAAGAIPCQDIDPYKSSVAMGVHPLIIPAVYTKGAGAKTVHLRDQASKHG
ncbi:hypothetical protein I7I51_04885 [Histoplasma capsulatum]|uniref:Uncharacterized protein n=1 Tax=Ajellomyces capsulatus TaxID=5037 RepID=A0A8A1M1Z1_AJECA|nr:hypothetical protein I7I51_04885 [Histoplasma capsulatum]